jgi:hypothetical protein
MLSSSPLCSFIQPLIYSFLGPNIPSTPSSQIPSVYDLSLFNIRDQVSRPYKPTEKFRYCTFYFLRFRTADEKREDTETEW